MQFSTTSGNSSPTDLIPNGFLCWAMLTFHGMKDSSTGGRHGDLEFVIADNQPNARRKIWDIVADPDFEGNSEKWRAMGMTALTRMLESSEAVDPKVPATYEQYNGATCEQILQFLDGKYVAIRVKVEKGDEGYQDKNKVGDYLTPNEGSSGFKNFAKLKAGDHGVTANPATRGNGPAGGFRQANNAPPPAGGGFGQRSPQGGAAPASLPFGAQSSMMKSPSEGPQGEQQGFNPNKAPAFLTNHQR